MHLVKRLRELNYKDLKINGRRAFLMSHRKDRKCTIFLNYKDIFLSISLLHLLRKKISLDDQHVALSRNTLHSYIHVYSLHCPKAL